MNSCSCRCDIVRVTARTLPLPAQQHTAMPAIAGCAACLQPAATVRRSRPSRSRPCCHHRTLVLASAASVPTPGNSSSSGGNGSPQPHASDGPSSDAVDLAAALNQPASSSTRSGGGALWRWFKGQQESRSRLAALGLAAVLSYGGCAACCVAKPSCFAAASCAGAVSGSREDTRAAAALGCTLLLDSCSCCRLTAGCSTTAVEACCLAAALLPRLLL